MSGSKVSVAVLVLTASAAITGCVNGGKAGGYKATEVVERVGNKSETPEWATGETTMTEEGGKIVFVNVLSMSADSRSEACTKAAADTARVEIVRHIKDVIAANGQVNETSAASDPGVESLMSFLAQGKLSGVSVQQKYWEKRLESDSAGQQVLRLHCAAKVAINKTDLNRQLRDAMGSGGNPEIRQKLLDSNMKFIEGAGNQENETK